ncbi:MAG: FAD binding domain-containing protein [Peptococcaceae bacterium]|jgi:carbon-monoxide dehydrogenase medium subunit|nr:FAD binding domain-containing protein [Peptococcaceae bacterium]
MWRRPLFVIDAVLMIAGGGREVPVADLCVGMNKTILAPDEIITEISLPPVEAGSHSAFMKAGKTSASIAKANAAILLVIRESKCTKARIALGSVAPTVIRPRKAENALTGETIDDKLIRPAPGLPPKKRARSAISGRPKNTVA